MLRLRPRPVILCADGCGLAAGVTRGILELARNRSISATSAFVTFPRWAEDGPRLAGARDVLSLGLHLNLTLGAPLGSMPKLAVDGRLPAVTALRFAAVRGSLDMAEIKAEIGRQLASFERGVGFPPDHIDSHEHVHTLPIVRRALLDAIDGRGLSPRPLLRDTYDRPLTIAIRGGEMGPALGHTIMAAGFGAQARHRGYPTNRGFSGYSAFDTSRMYAVELAHAFRGTGRRHLVMCHPGHPDAELAALDGNTLRRGQEFDAISNNQGIKDQLWTVIRDPDGPNIEWPRAFPDGR